MLGDKDIMAFGVHKGKELRDVPAEYLSWLFNAINSKTNKSQYELSLIEYIKDNWDVLIKEINENRARKF